MKKPLRFLSCFLVLSFIFIAVVFSVSAETTTFSNSNLTYGDYELNHSGNLVSTTINIVPSGIYRVFQLKSGSYANFGFLQIHNKNGGFIFKNPSQYPARFSLYVNTYTGSDQTVINYQHSLTVFINGGISAGVNLIGRDTEVSRWEIYYQIPAGINFQIDSIDISCSFPAQKKTCEFWIKSPTLTYQTDGEYLGNKIDSLPQYQDNFNGSYDVGGNALNGAEQNNMNAAADGLDGAKGFFNGMLDNISSYGSAFSVISLLMSKLFSNVPSLYGIVNFSVALGLFALLIGVLLGAVHRSQREDRIRAERASRQSRRKGGSS